LWKKVWHSRRKTPKMPTKHLWNWPAPGKTAERLKKLSRISELLAYRELLYGALKCNRPIENVDKVRRIAELYPIIDISHPIIDIFVPLRLRLEQEGQRLEDFDLFIAATALHLDYTLVTGNSRHFERIQNLRIENWAA
jgi:tRNA(fMet)-specific endonuclease VapC